MDYEAIINNFKGTLITKKSIIKSYWACYTYEKNCFLVNFIKIFTRTHKILSWQKLFYLWEKFSFTCFPEWKIWIVFHDRGRWLWNFVRMRTGGARTGWQWLARRTFNYASVEFQRKLFEFLRSQRWEIYELTSFDSTSNFGLSPSRFSSVSEMTGRVGVD